MLALKWLVLLKAMGENICIPYIYVQMSEFTHLF